MSLVSDKLKKIVVTFDGPPTLGSTTVSNAPLRYNKRFAMTFQMDDNPLDLYTHGYKYLQGGVIGGTTYPGVHYTDGCGNKVKFKITGCIYPFNNATPGSETQIILDDNSSSVYISWPQIAEMRKNGHAFVCHGLSGGVLNNDYEMLRSISFARKKTWANGVPGGMRLYSFTPPNGATDYTLTLKRKYFNVSTREGSTYGMPTSNIAVVNVVAGGPDDLYRMNAYGSNSILDRATQAYNLSLGNDRMWSINFNHSVTGATGYDFASFKSYIDGIYNTYGAAGNDTIWFATEEEIHNYLLLRDAVTPSFTIVGNTVEITFAGTVDDALNYYGLSLNVASDKNIVSITGSIDGIVKSNGVGKTSGLINIDWNGKNVQVAEDLAEIAVAAYETNQTLQYALVARDYIEMCGNGRATEGFKARLVAKTNPFPIWTAINQNAQVTQGVAPGAGNALVALGDLRPYGSGGPANYTLETQASRGGSHTWNNWRDTSLAAAALTLKKADGTITPWTFKLTKSIQTNYLGGGKSTGSNTGFFPDRVLSNVAFSNSGSPYGINSANAVEWTISGLTQANTYTIRTLADRDNTYDNSPRHAVNGVEKLPLYKQNTSSYCEWLNVVPVAGAITLRVYGGDQWGMGFINGVEIIEVPGVVNSYYPGAATNLTMTLDSGINQYKLAWSAADAGLTNWEVWRADQETGEWAKRADVVAANSFYVDNFVSPNKSYHYKIKTVGPDGTLSGFSASIAFTYPEGTAILTPPTGLAAFNVKANGTSLSWGSVAENATRVKIYRKLATDNTYTNINYVLVTSGASFIDTTAAPSTAYNYAISIWNTGGESALSMALDVTTLTPPPAPTTPTGFTVGTPKDMNSLTLSWVTPAYTDSILVYKYNISTTVYDLIATLDGSNSSYLVTGLVMSTSYSFKIASINSTATSAQTAIVSGTTSDPPIPTTPSGPTCTPVSDTRIDMAWPAVTWATSYKVYRSTTANGTYSLVQTLGNVLTASDTGLTCFTQYYYEIVAINVSGSSALSTSGTATTLLPPIPVTPTLPSAVAVSPYQINISWTSVSGAVGYNIYRSLTSGGTYTLLSSVGMVSTIPDSGLNFLTPYFYKVSATNLGGESPLTTYVTVTTQAPPAPVGLISTPLSQFQIDLSWTASVGATGYKVYRSTTSNGTYTLLRTLGNVLAVSDAGLPFLTQYFYKVTVTNASGESGLSTYTTSTTLAPPIPSIPTGLGASASSYDTVNISWEAQIGATGYKLYRSTTLGGTYSLVIALGNVLTTNDTGLQFLTTFFYKATATNAGGESAMSPSVTVTTLTLPVPLKPTGLVVTNLLFGTLTITWNLIASTTSVEVYRKFTGAGSFGPPIVTLGSTIFSYNDAGLTEMTSYQYQIIGVNQGGSSPVSDSVTITTPINPIPPVKPGNLSVTGITKTTITVSWLTTLRTSKFELYRSYAVDGVYTKLSNVLSSTDLIATDTGLNPNTGYWYRIVAIASDGTANFPSAPSNSLFVTTALPDPPTTPGGLTVTPSVSNTDIQVTWAASSGYLITGYKLYRATSVSGPFLTPYMTLGNVLSFNDSALGYSEGHFYKVAAFNDGGDSVISSVAVGGTTIQAPAPVGFSATSLSDTTIRLTWSAVVFASDYQIFRSNVSGTGFVSIGTTPSLTFDDASLTFSTTEYYKVVARNINAVNGTLSSERTATTNAPAIPSAPTLSSVTTLSYFEIQIAWTVSSGNPTGYEVYRSLNPTVGFSKVKTLGLVNIWIDNTLSYSTQYYYKVLATNSGGSSTYSSTVGGTTNNYPSPTKPSGLSISGATFSSQTLNWGAISNCVSIKVFRKLTSDLTFGTEIATLGSSAINYQDTGLTGSTSYSYKVIAYNIGGASPDSDVLIATTPFDTTPPVKPTGLNAQGVSKVSIRLTWNLVPSAVGYTIYSAPTVAGPFTTLTTINDGSIGEYMDSTLATDESKAYYIVAFNSNGSSINSDFVVGKSLSEDIPGTPVGLTITKGTNFSLNISWVKSTGATSYFIYRSSTITGVYNLYKSLGDINAYNDASLGYSTTWYYKVSARNTSGESALSLQSNGTTDPIPIPDAPSGITFSSIASTQVTISWDVCARALSYEVLKATSEAGPYTSVSSTSGTVVNATSLLPSTTYYFKIASINGTGNSSTISTVTTSGIALPTSPTGVTASASSTSPTSEVNLSWGVAARAEGYKVYQSSSANGTYTYIKDVVGTSTIMAGLNSGVGYYFKVVSFNTSGTSGFSSYTYIVTQSIPAPLTPQGVSVMSLGNTSAQIAWETSAGATGYTVLRSSTLGGTYSVVASVGMVLSVVDSELASGRTYYYKVSAFSVNGSSLPSSPILVTTNSDGTALSYGFSGVVKFGDEVVVGATVVVWDMTDKSVGAVLTSDSDGFYYTASLVMSHDYLLIGYLSNVSGSFGSFSRILGRPVIM